MKFPDFFLTKSQFYWLLKHQENMIFWPSHEFTWVIQMRNKWLQQSLWQRINIMMTSSNENIFRVTDPLCGEFTGPGGFPTQRPVTRSFDVFFDLRLNKRLSKQPWGWWFETLSWSLSGVPDFFDRNKILSGYDLSHYQVPHCIRVFFYFVWFVFIHHNFQFYFKLCTYCNILDIYLS